jgi:purine-binding chemotaxis protein CheW
MITAEKDMNRFLFCRTGSCIAALPLIDIREIMRPLQVEPLSAAPDFVLGVAVVRGIPTPVVDAEMLLCASSLSSDRAASHSGSRFILLKVGERAVALVVDAVLDTRSLPTGIPDQIPPLLHHAGTQVVGQIGALDTTLLLVLQTARLVPDSVWSAMQASEAAA